MGVSARNAFLLPHIGLGWDHLRHELSVDSLGVWYRFNSVTSFGQVGPSLATGPAIHTMMRFGMIRTAITDVFSVLISFVHVDGDSCAIQVFR